MKSNLLVAGKILQGSFFIWKFSVEIDTKQIAISKIKIIIYQKWPYNA